MNLPASQGAGRFPRLLQPLITAPVPALGGSRAGTEVYSLIRNSHLVAEEYVTGFFDTGGLGRGVEQAIPDQGQANGAAHAVVIDDPDRPAHPWLGAVPRGGRGWRCGAP